MKKYDLILKGARVLDPSRNMDGVFDVAVKDGKIRGLEKEIPAEEGEKVLEVSGYLLTPGLVDMHCHIYPRFPFEEDGLPTIQGEAHMFRSGVTACVDAGTCGSRDFLQFKESVIDRSKLKIFAFVNIASGGMVNLESEQDIQEFQPEIAAAIAGTYDCVAGIKTAHYWVGKPVDSRHPAWESVEQAVKAGELCGKPVMADFQPNLPWRTYPDLILEKLRPGDIHTHVYAQQFPILDANRNVQEFMFRARDRGVIFDLGHGAGSFWFRNAVPALKQGFYPDTISTDLYLDNVNGPVIDLLHVMSKYLNMGMPIEEVIYRTTKRPAEIIGHEELGDLKIGGEADIALLDIREGDFGFADAGHASMRGTKKLECIMTIRAGEIVYNPMALGMPEWEHAPRAYWESPGVI